MLKIGDRIRAEEAGCFGTLGFFCEDADGIPYLASCDHVMKTPVSSDNGPENICYEIDDPDQNTVAVFEGKGLVNQVVSIADFAVARAVMPIDRSCALPLPMTESGITHFSGTGAAARGETVYMWGARTGYYVSGVVRECNGQLHYTWPHVTYGRCTYDLQFSVELQSDHTVRVGDSGGYIITGDGRLVGLIAALSGERTASGCARVHCVPVEPCLARLNLTII